MNTGTLGDLLDTAGPALLSVVCAPTGLYHRVGGIVVHDRRAPVPTVADGLLFAVGLSPEDDELAPIVREAGAAGYCAVVVRALGAELAALVPVAERARIALLAASDDVDWGQLQERVTLALPAAPAEEGADDGPPLGDLFAFANAVALSVGAAIAIEDPQRRVLAYSNLPDQPIDEVRRQGILGRQVPELPDNDEDYRVMLRAPGPVRFAPVPPHLVGRMGAAVRAGSELLGSLWAIDEGGSLDAGAERALSDAARIAALHLLHARSRRGLERSERARTLRALLFEGDLNGEFSADRHGIRHDTPAVVAAFSIGSGELVDDQIVRLADLVSLQLEARHAATLVTTSGVVVYAALPLADGAGSDSLSQTVTAVAEAAHRSLGAPVRAVVGDRVVGAASLARSARSAERVLQALAWTELGDVVVTSSEEQEARLLLQQLLDRGAADDAQLISPVRQMLEHDDRTRTAFARSVLVFLSEGGSMPAAADRLSVHANTLRHRLQRARVLFGLDLDDPDTRLVTWLQLRLLTRRGRL